MIITNYTYLMKRFYLFMFVAFVAIISVSAQQYPRKTNLPTIYINTYDNMPVTSKEIYSYAVMHYVDEQDKVTVYDSLQIRGRGNSTWRLSKKPYRIKFKEKEKFLGKGYAKAKSWTLLANAGDKTLMRNAVTSAMGEFAKLKFNPAYKFVDLVLNNVYLGNYQISDQVEVRPHRVDITEQDLPLQDSSNVSGGYLLEVDGFMDGNWFNTPTYTVPVRIHYPDEEDIVWRQNNYIHNYMRNFEAVLSSDKYADKDKGYRAWIDSVSLANWYIATEISGNIDGFYSTYFYKDCNDTLLYWGPLWDYDIAYANDTRLGDTRYQMMTDVGYGQTKLWINRMWTDKWFQRLINRRFQELIDGGLENRMYQVIDSLQNLLSNSQQLNYNKWGIRTRAYHEVVLFSSYDQYVADLKDYISKHISYLASAFADKKPQLPTPVFIPEDYYYRITNAQTNKAIDLRNAQTTSGTEIVAYDNNEERESEDWQIKPVGNYFIITNRSADVSLTDNAQGGELSTHLTATTTVANNTRQQWSIVPQGTAGYYNLVNRQTGLTANLSGGNSANNTPIVSYTTDSRNATSKNRLWYITPSVEITTGISTVNVEPENYALAYNKDEQLLHFGSDTPESLTFKVSVYDINGKLLGTFAANEYYSVSNLPSGVYIITWHVGGKTRSIKLKK